MLLRTFPACGGRNSAAEALLDLHLENSKESMGKLKHQIGAYILRQWCPMEVTSDFELTLSLGVCFVFGDAAGGWVRGVLFIKCDTFTYNYHEASQCLTYQKNDHVCINYTV